MEHSQTPLWRCSEFTPFGCRNPGSLFSLRDTFCHIFHINIIYGSIWIRRREGMSVKKIYFLAAAAVSALLFTAGACILLNRWQAYRAADEIYEELKEAVEDTAQRQDSRDERGTGPSEEEAGEAVYIDWERFAGTDCVGFLILDDIRYPVMQAEDNITYLHALPDGSYNYAGSLFLYADNCSDFSDVNSFVYGHSMADGSMFGKLSGIRMINMPIICFLCIHRMGISIHTGSSLSHRRKREAGLTPMLLREKMKSESI